MRCPMCLDEDDGPTCSCKYDGPVTSAELVGARVTLEPATDDLRTRLARLRGVIEGLRETCEAMTPGPWIKGLRDGEESVEPLICQLRARACMDVREAQCHDCRCQADAKGIAESRTWLPRCCPLRRRGCKRRRTCSRTSTGGPTALKITKKTPR
jgi:hypothetical protein